MAAEAHADASHGSEPRTFCGSSSSEEVPPGAIQKYWTPNIGCNIRISLATGIPEYAEYVQSISRANRRRLRHCGGDGTVSYFGSQTRSYPKAIWPQMMKLRPDSVPLYPGHEEVSAYFPFGETAVNDLIEGQLAFLHHVRSYEEAHPGTRFFAKEPFPGRLSFSTAALEAFLKSSWMRSPLRSLKSSGLAARPTRGLSATARLCLVLFGTSLVKSWANIWKHLWSSWTTTRPCGLSTGSRGSFSPSSWRTARAVSRRGLHLLLAPLSAFWDWDFTIGISAIQGHSRMPEQVSTVAQGEKLTLARARELGHIFHAAENANYESIKSDGLLIRATRKGWQKHRVAIHLTYAGGTESPGPGTVIRYGANVFYAKLDVESFFNHGHDLFLTDNGVVLCYEDIAPMLPHVSLQARLTSRTLVDSSTRRSNVRPE